MEWLNTMEQILALIVGLCGLIGTGVSTFIAVKNAMAKNKIKNVSDLWTMVMTWTDAAIKSVEKTGKKGADKKAMVIEAVKDVAKASNVDIDDFMDQLSAYIDQTVDFANNFNKKVN